MMIFNKKSKYKDSISSLIGLIILFSLVNAKEVYALKFISGPLVKDVVRLPDGQVLGSNVSEYEIEAEDLISSKYSKGYSNRAAYDFSYLRVVGKKIILVIERGASQEKFEVNKKRFKDGKFLIDDVDFKLLDKYSVGEGSRIKLGTEFSIHGDFK